MSKQRFVVCVVAAWVNAALVSPCAAQAIDPCREHVLDREPVRRGGVARDDGVVWFRVAFQHGVELAHQKAFEGGMALWNAHRFSTGVAFELAKSSIIDLRIQRGAPVYVKERVTDTLSEIDKVKMDEAEQTKCAEYVSDGPYIWYSPNLLKELEVKELEQTEKWLKEDVKVLMTQDPRFAALAKMYAHELGHVLAIGHDPNRDGLMREGAADRKCWEQKLADMQSADVKVAEECVWRERKLRRPRKVEKQP